MATQGVCECCMAQVGAATTLAKRWHTEENDVRHPSVSVLCEAFKVPRWMEQSQVAMSAGKVSSNHGKNYDPIIFFRDWSVRNHDILLLAAIEVV